MEKGERSTEGEDRRYEGKGATFAIGDLWRGVLRLVTVRIKERDL